MFACNKAETKLTKLPFAFLDVAYEFAHIIQVVHSPKYQIGKAEMVDHKIGEKKNGTKKTKRNEHV